MLTCTHACTHTCMHTHAHVRTRAQAQTHTHTHTQNLISLKRLLAAFTLVSPFAFCRFSSLCAWRDMGCMHWREMPLVWFATAVLTHGYLSTVSSTFTSIAFIVFISKTWQLVHQMVTVWWAVRGTGRSQCLQVGWGFLKLWSSLSVLQFRHGDR